MELIKEGLIFMFSGFWHFIGCLMLLGLLINFVTNILQIRITNIYLDNKTINALTSKDKKTLTDVFKKIIDVDNAKNKK